MKTTIFFTCMAFFLSAKIVHAGNDIDSPGTVPLFSTEIFLKSLAPITPKEATFDEDTFLSRLKPAAMNFAPSVPGTADFDEIQPEMSKTKKPQKTLGPSTPAEVDFNEPGPTTPLKMITCPFAPKEASFDDPR